MKVIFDLDYTLLDTIKLKKDLAKVLGLSAEEYNEQYKKFFKDRGINWNLERHLEILRTEKGISKDEEEAIRHNFTELLKKMDEYLLPGAEETLRKYKRKGDELILATFGDIDWHKLKVENSKVLMRNLDHIIYEDKDKTKNAYLRFLRDSGENILIVNDNAKESFELLKLLGKNSELRLVDGPYARNVEHNHKIENISELPGKKIISQEHKIK